jgi:hypothetical protein
VTTKGFFEMEQNDDCPMDENIGKHLSIKRFNNTNTIGPRIGCHKY